MSEWLAEHFQQHRGHLHAVASRMLGSAGEADDAMQEAWLRLSRADTGEVQNLRAWLTTVVGRVCLNTLRSRERRHEDPLDTEPAGNAATPEEHDPEHEAVLADSLGMAMLVVLNTLAPAERLAFVLHDMFGVPFEEIAVIVDRSPAATRQLASRGRRRVRGQEPERDPDQARQRRVVEAFLAAARDGDFEALVAVLDPQVELHADAAAGPTPRPFVLHGSSAVAGGASAAATRARMSQQALIDGRVGLALVRRGELRLVLDFTTSGEAVTRIDIIAEPERLAELDITMLDG